MLDGLVVEPEEGVQRTALLQLSHGMSEYIHCCDVVQVRPAGGKERLCI